MARSYNLPGENLGLLAGGGSQSVVVIFRSTYDRGGGGGADGTTYVSFYGRVNISRLLILQSLH